MMHSWISKPKFDSVEALNSDLSELKNSTIQIYCACLDFISSDDLLKSPAAYTKLANILHTNELQKRLDAEKIPIVAMSIHPGTVWTGKDSSSICHHTAMSHDIFEDGAQDYTGSLPGSTLWLRLLHLACVEAPEGAYTGAFAAASPVVQALPGKYKGQYLVPVGKIQKPAVNAQNPQFAKDLWESSEKALAAFK